MRPTHAGLCLDILVLVICSRSDTCAVTASFIPAAKCSAAQLLCHNSKWFLEGYSAATNLVYTSYEFALSVRNVVYVYVVFLDFTKVFSSISLQSAV